jgi:valyl-tRNA synthetase
MQKSYNPKDFEEEIYKLWNDNNAFKAEIDSKKTPYTIVIPPPNITGQLHMGHALDNTLQDILIRWKRMSGYSALWLPGTDHASIATEAKIVEAMSKEGITKDDIGREIFLERAWEWKKQYGGRIVEQLKKLGSSCDWSRERFTLDEGCSLAVKEVFVNLYEKGLIYRGERIINWCPTCLTSISDAEVEYEEQDGYFWNLKYFLSDGSDFLELATTRPETLLGDTAVAVNPKDTRYQKYVGKTVILPLVGREIPIIADDYVDMEFGTGVVKITPAHDPNDFEVGLRHKLPIVNVLTDDAKITADYPKYAGLDCYEARKIIVKDLEESQNWFKIEPHKHNVGTCYRCSTTVQPRVSKQWFVEMKPLAEPAIDAVKTGKTKFVPERFNKTYFHWLENIKDWCISRQLWWGHRIPAFYCEDCGEITVSKENVEICPKCESVKMHQDPDTLDTWFSSALWPFSTLGYPEKTKDLEYFYPTNTLVTGYDIIFFWVVRMMFSGIEHMGEIPFDTVFIHGLVRDEQGRKMSKSLGNGIDPLEIIEKFGADALRFTLITGNAPGSDMRFSEKKVKVSSQFANKIWNAARFILMNIPQDFAYTGLPKMLNIEDKWLLSNLNNISKELDNNLKNFEIGLASETIQNFIWDIYCDWYIEFSKPRLTAGDCDVTGVLLYVMRKMLALLHPFMPFITEEIWQIITNDNSLLMLQNFPVYDENFAFESEAKDFQIVIDIIKSVRNLRTEMNVPPSQKANIFIDSNKKMTIEAGSIFIKKMAFANEVNFVKDVPKDCVSCVTADANIFIPLSELVDKDKETARLSKEIKNVEKDIEFLQNKLNNQGFVSKAPEKVVQDLKNKLSIANEKMSKISKNLENLK